VSSTKFTLLGLNKIHNISAAVNPENV